MNFLKKVSKLLMAGILSTELVLVLDLAAVFFDMRMTPVFFAAALAVASVLLFLFAKFTWKQVLAATGVMSGAIVLICAISFGIWYPFQKNGAYHDVDSGKAQVYGGRDVMLIVPHQDDEINVLGGVIEELVNYGSNVRIVFVTNGDYDGIPETRMGESIAYGALVGIPEENIIFLGYGDVWNVDDGVHIYNAPSGTVVSSRYGAVQTYGMESHPAFREGNAYTVENYLSDMEAVILRYRPEVIFCSDYDQHIEHMATSLAFEKVMGRILRQNPDYKPLVYKGYAYSSAWYAEADYYRINILSTRNVFAEPHCNKPVVYDWEEGIRFPVDVGTLSRSLIRSQAYAALAVHASQNAHTFADSVVNGDRVFWQRRTDSLCTDAEVTVSSGNGAYLNNFMLIDNFDLWEQENPYDSVWIPAEEDPDKRLEVAFTDAKYLHSVVLYDHPSDADNILNALITFDDGSTVETGALEPGGSATEIVVEKSNVTSFSVALTAVEGGSPGLTEVEALPVSRQGDMAFAKLMDAAGEYAYDYCLTEGDSAAFSLYTYGMEAEAFRVSSDNEKIQVSVSGKDVTVHCPVGEEGTITVYDGDGSALDSIYVWNPGLARRIQIHLGQTIEEYAAFKIRNSVAFRMGKRAVKLLERVF